MGHPVYPDYHWSLEFLLKDENIKMRQYHVPHCNEWSTLTSVHYGVVNYDCLCDH